MLLREFIKTLLEGETTSDLLVDAISSNPRFKIVSSIPSPRKSGESIYYISSGARTVRYTLRVKSLEAWQSHYSGESGHNERDNHVGTLGTAKNIPNVISNALSLVGDDSVIYYKPIVLGQRAAAGPRSILKFGKYKGQDIHELVHQDPGYVDWLYLSIKTEPASFLNKDSYKTFRDEVIVANESEPAVMEIINKKNIELEQNKKRATEREEQRKKDEENKLLSQHVGMIGKRQDFIVTYVGSGSWQTQGYGYGTGTVTMYAHKFKTDEGNFISMDDSRAYGKL